MKNATYIAILTDKRLVNKPPKFQKLENQVTTYTKEEPKDPIIEVSKVSV